MKWTRVGMVLGGVAVVGALFLGRSLIFGGTAEAQGGQGQQRLQHVEEVLAGKLSISVDQLNQALTDTRNQLIDEAVQAGKLTAARATTLKSKPLGQSLVLLFKLQHAKRVAARSIVKAAAQTMNLDAKTVVSELQQGKSLAQIASEHGVTAATLQTGILNIEKTNLQNAVSKGKLTQAQADKLYNALSNNIDKIINRTRTPKP